MACKVCPTDCTAGAILPTIGNDCPLYDTSSVTGIMISSEALPSISDDPNFNPPDVSGLLTTVSADIVARIDNNDELSSSSIRHFCIEGSIPVPERNEIRTCEGGYVKGSPLYTFELQVKDLSYEAITFWNFLDKCQTPVHFYIYTNAHVYGADNGGVNCMESFKGSVSFDLDVTAAREFNTGTVQIKVETFKGLTLAPVSQFDGVPFNS